MNVLWRRFGVSKQAFAIEERVIHVYFSYPYNRPWRPIGLRDVEAPTFT
jgi:hypothetical protein